MSNGTVMLIIAGVWLFVAVATYGMIKVAEWQWENHVGDALDVVSDPLDEEDW